MARSRFPLTGGPTELADAQPRPPQPHKASPRRASPRTGYAAEVAINLVLLYLVNGRPGWEALGFLTPQAASVMRWVNACLVVGIVANLAYLAFPAAWVRPAGEALRAALAVATCWAWWQVFPFDFSGTGNAAELVARWVIGLGIVGGSVAVVVNLVNALRRVGA